MKKFLQNVPFVANRIETIDFKTFIKCERGNLNFQETTIRPTLDLLKSCSPKTGNVTTYSLIINPLAFFDGRFLIAAGCVVLVAVLEKKLADNGIIGAAAALSGLLRLSLPIVGLGSILYLISKLGVFI